jgi:hypothetical protein
LRSQKENFINDHNTNTSKTFFSRQKAGCFFFFCKIFSLIHIFSYFTDLGFGAAQNDTLPVIRAVGGTASDEGGAPRATLRALPSLPLLLAEADGVGEVEVVDAAGGFS